MKPLLFTLTFILTAQISDAQVYIYGKEITDAKYLTIELVRSMLPNLYHL